MQSQIQNSNLPPAQPSYVLRGHKAQVHALCFWRSNSRLLSGDAEGHVILWDTTTKRARVVWRAHDGGILGLGIWDAEKVIRYVVVRKTFLTREVTCNEKVRAETAG